jgi:hypothetical protein
MRRTMKLALLMTAAALLVPASAAATRTFNPTSLSFQSPLGKESPGQTATYSVDAAEPAFNRTVNPFISTPSGGACTPPPNGGCVFRFTTTCPVFPAALPAGDQSCSFTVYYNQDTPGTAEAELHANVSGPAVTLLGKVIAGKKKKCKKKSGGTRRSAAVAKKKCKKKKR